MIRQKKKQTRFEKEAEIPPNAYLPFSCEKKLQGSLQRQSREFCLSWSGSHFSSRDMAGHANVSASLIQMAWQQLVNNRLLSYKLLFFIIGHSDLIKKIIQTAVINIVFKRILLNLTFRMLVNIHFQKYTVSHRCLYYLLLILFLFQSIENSLEYLSDLA